MSIFTNIQVGPLKMDVDAHSRPNHKWCNWCGRLASYSVTRTGKASGHTHTDPACEACAEEWAIARRIEAVTVPVDGCT